jgi:hypothetical protein
MLKTTLGGINIIIWNQVIILVFSKKSNNIDKIHYNIFQINIIIRKSLLIKVF